MKSSIGSKSNPQIIWHEIIDYRIINRDEFRPNMFIQIESPSFKKPIWFTQSISGNYNYFGKVTLKSSDCSGWEWWIKDGWIIKLTRKT